MWAPIWGDIWAGIWAQVDTPAPPTLSGGGFIGNSGGSIRRRPYAMPAVPVIQTRRNEDDALLLAVLH